MKYSVKTIREAGLQCRWTKTRTGAPIIAATNPAKTDRWYVIDARMWKRAEVVGIFEAFCEHTALGDFFSISA